MLADQSILEKNYTETTEQQLNKTNNNTINPTTGNNVTVLNSNAKAAGNNLQPSAAQLANTPTIQRIGSIGRTTITCITPAGGDTNAAVANPQAALAAAGVELDTVEDNQSMTEVVVKIENSATSSQDEDEEMPDEDDEEPNTETNEDEDEEDGDMNYDDIKLSSPMMWAIDSVKIEQEEEEFEDILTAGLDNTNTMDNDEEFLQSASSQQAATNTGDMESQRNRILVAKKRVSLETLKSLKNSKTPYVTQIELQDPSELLEKHQHFQKLRLQPNQPVQIKLRSIPATITSIQPKIQLTTISGAPPLAPLSTLKATMAEINRATSTSSAEFKSTISEDRRYRMITQNQRTRKESLEHSEDMIYNADIEKPWICRNCNRNYKWKNSLKCHLKNECGQPPRYFCSKLCGYATNVHSNLKRHMNTKCRERNDDETPPMSLQQMQGSTTQLLQQLPTTATVSTSSSTVNTPTTMAASNSNIITNTNNASTTTSTTSTYTLVFQKSE